MELEQEFKAVKQNHMIKVCMQAIMEELYAEVEKGLNLPAFLMKDKIQQEAVSRVAFAMTSGELAFQKLYDECYAKVGADLE